jgi:y4mF family transcriptional regulator
MPHPPVPVRSAADVGAALRRLRKEQRLTQAHAAGLSDVGIRFLSELENGKPTVRLETLLRVLAAYGVELCIRGSGLEPPPEPGGPSGPGRSERP